MGYTHPASEVAIVFGPRANPKSKALWAFTRQVSFDTTLRKTLIQNDFHQNTVVLSLSCECWTITGPLCSKNLFLKKWKCQSVKNLGSQYS